MRPRHVATSTTLLLALASCSAEPAAPPPLTPSTGSPTTVPTQQAETAEEFIRRWIEADTRMQNTGDASEYLAMSYRCTSCDTFADRIEGIYSDGGYVNTLGWEIISIGKPEGPTEKPTVTFKAKSRPTKFVESRGGDVKRLPGGVTTTYQVQLVRRQGQWRTHVWYQEAA